MEKEKRDIKKNTLDKSVLKHIIQCSYGLVPAGTLACYLLRAKLPEKFIEGFLAGSLGGLANLYFLILIIVSTINPSGVQKIRALIGTIGINASLVVILYPAYAGWASPMGLAVGFTLVLAIMLTGAMIAIRKKGK